MKIIHCADLHLDSKMTSNLPPEKARERRSELLITFQKLISYAVENGVSHILIAGDLFDTKKVSATARNAVYQAIVNNSQISFYYLKGNHDADSFLGNLETVPENLFLFDYEWKTYHLSDKVTLSGVEVGQVNRDDIYSALVLDNEKWNIVMLHGQETEHGGKDRAETIRLRDLKNKGIDYLALGHVHAYQKGDLDARGTYCYSGCLEGRGFDECGEHGFVMLEINEETGESSHRFVPIAKRELFEFQVDVSECMTTDDMVNVIANQLNEQQIDQRHMVRVVLDGAVDVECEYSINLLTKCFEEQFYFFRIKDKTIRRVDYQEYLLDASLKGEFVRTVMADERLSEEDKASIVRYGIMALAGEEI